MTTNKFFLEDLQGELTRAFKWMARATELAQKGEFTCATYDLTVALQYMTKCQHIDDKFIDAQTSEEIDWNFFTLKALAQAKKEIKEELEEDAKTQKEDTND